MGMRGRSLSHARCRWWDPRTSEAIVLLQVPSRTSASQSCESGSVEDVHSTGGAALLALEPAPETAGVKDVVTGKLLAARDHLLPANGTEVGLLKLLLCGVWTAAYIVHDIVVTKR